ncbi:MAG: S41 family peptidase [Gammaproteobacteria bacterium]|nr:S41 family peptidase [Gammaproteobacteria bacterium]
MKLPRPYGKSLLPGLLLGLLVIATATADISKQNSIENDALPLDQLRNFSDIFSRIKSDYVEEVEDTDLLKHAIKGMLSGLDPHSSYLDPNEYEELQIGTTGEFGGLGIQVGMEDGFVKVISPIDDTPAFHAGLKSGDLIIRIDQKPVKGMTLNDAVNIMRGKPGTKITLLVLREGNNEPLTFVLERAIIKVKSVKSRILQQDYGYVRISTFQSRTAHHLIEAIDQLVEDNKQSLKGLVLDLRNNPGGVLNAASEVSDLFLNEGLIVFTKGRVKNSYYEYRAKPGDALGGAPLVVLINGGSASASEIVAGALQDHKRAILMGSKSFGKGSVQTIQELRNGGAVKMTTARYYTPSGRSIQAQGIVPDIILEDLQLTEKDHNGIKQIKESDLSGHLENPNGDEAPEGKDISTTTKDDYAIREALNLLKGLHIFQKAN